jgi:hypothetical protein
LADATMTFRGTLAAINAALDGLVFLPALNYVGPATLTLTTNDLGNSGSGGARTDTDAVTISVLSPQQQADNASGQVDGLVAGGTLTAGQGNALTSKLQQAKAKIQQGQITAAVSLLNAFINQVNSLIADGLLSAADGALLIAAANDILTGITT